METKTKMTTQEKSTELVQDLGIEHAIYVTEEILTTLKDWEGTELAQNDWVEIYEIIRGMKKLTFKPYKEQILVQSSIEGEVIWEDKKYSDVEVLNILLNCPTNTEKETIEWFKQISKENI